MARRGISPPIPGGSERSGQITSEFHSSPWRAGEDEGRGNTSGVSSLSLDPSSPCLRVSVGNTAPSQPCSPAATRPYKSHKQPIFPPPLNGLKTGTYDPLKPAPGLWTVWQLPCMICGSHEPNAVSFVAKEPETQTREKARGESDGSRSSSRNRGGPVLRDQDQDDRPDAFDLRRPLLAALPFRPRAGLSLPCPARSRAGWGASIPRHWAHTPEI
jgi:hypothetical protein